MVDAPAQLSGEWARSADCTGSKGRRQGVVTGDIYMPMFFIILWCVPIRRAIRA